MLPGPGDDPGPALLVARRRGRRADRRGGGPAPRALAFGITTGLGAAVGLTTAIVAGLVAGIFGGSNLQVSGPTGAMAVVLVPIVARYGPRSVLTVGLLAGVLILSRRSRRLVRRRPTSPWPVVEGFALGSDHGRLIRMRLSRIGEFRG